MACVNRLRAELMGSLGFEVGHPPLSRPNPGERRRKIRRHREDYGKEAVNIPDPRTLPRQQQQQQQQHRWDGADGNRIVDRRHARPESAKLSRVSSCSLGRPTSASSARHSASGSKADGGGCSANRDMEVLLEICRDQGRAGSLNPADFDSSISAIANLPVKEFMGAAKLGWGPYFRNLHSKMRRERTASIAATRMNRPPLERRRRSRQQQPQHKQALPRTALGKSARANTQSTMNGQRGKAAGNSKLRKSMYSRNVATNSSSSNSSSAGVRLMQRRRTGREDGNYFDGLAASRARATKREDEEGTTRRLANRLQALWQELKIPDPDRAYIMAVYLEEGGGGRGFGDGESLLRTSSRTSAGGGEAAIGSGGARRSGSSTSDDVQRELARQIILLLEHRASTVKVLRSVTMREARLTEVEQALQAFKWHRGLDTDAVGLVDALRGLRDTSLAVARAIVEWRTNLWQPRAFCWQGVNYLEKMSRDAGFLRSPAGESLLASVGLDIEEMVFVAFPPTGFGGASSAEAGDDYVGDFDCDSDESDAEGEVTNSDLLRPPPAIVRLTPNAELASEYRARYFDISCPADVSGAGGEGGAAGRQGGTGVENAARRWAEAATYDGGAANAAEAFQMQAVVVQEAALQRRVETERIRLATKGCFVPLLRWLPGDKGNAVRKGKRQRPSSSPAMLPPSDDAIQTPAVEPKTNDGSSNSSNDKNGAPCSDIDDGDVDHMGNASDAAVLPSRCPARRVLPPPFPSQDGLPPPVAKAAAAERRIGSMSSGAPQERSAGLGGRGRKDGENELEELERDGEQQVSSQPGQEGGSRHAHRESWTADNSHGSSRPAESPKNRRISAEDSGGFASHADGSVEKSILVRNMRRNPNGNVPLDTSRHVDNGLQPLETEEGSVRETEINSEDCEGDGAEGRAHQDGCLDRRANDVSNSEEKMTGINGGPDDSDMEPLLSSRVRQQYEGHGDEGVGDEGEKSKVPSIGYDDDFEEDAQEYSLSDSDRGGDGASNDQHNTVQSKCSTSDPHNRNVAYHAEDAQSTGVESVPAERRIDMTVEADGVDIVEHMAQPEERPSEHQLVEEREYAATTAASQIQKSVRAWLRHRSLSSDEKFDAEEQRESAEKERQDWLHGWRARRHSLVKQTQNQLQSRDESAVKIQSAVRAKLAFKKATILRRESDARNQAAAMKIQALVRRRGRNAAGSRLVESSIMTDESSRILAVTDGTPVALKEEQACAAIVPVSDSERETTRNTRSAVTIQRAVRGANRRKRLSTEKIDGADASSSTVGVDQRTNPEGAEQHQAGTGEREKGPGAVPDQGGATYFTCSKSLASPVSSHDDREKTTMAQENDEREQQQEQGREEGVGGPSFSPRYLPSIDSGAAIDVPGDGAQLDKDKDTDTVADTSADAMMTTVVSSRPGDGIFPSASSAVGLSSVPECRPLVSVVASASEYGSDDLNFDALSSSLGGSGSDSSRGGSSSSSGSGSGSGSSFGNSFSSSFSSSSGSSSSGDGKGRKANTDIVPSVDAAAAAKVLVDTSSPDVVDGKKNKQPPEIRGPRGEGAVAIVTNATDKDLAQNVREVDTVETREATRKEVGPEVASDVGGDSGGSFVFSLSVASSSS